MLQAALEHGHAGRLQLDGRRDLRRVRRARARGCATAADRALRDVEARGRGVPGDVQPAARDAARVAALRERLRAAPGPARRGGRRGDLLQQAARGRPAEDLRRRLGRRATTSTSATSCARRWPRPSARRRGLQRRHRARDVGRRAARAVPADCGHERRSGVRRRRGRASCSGASSTRRARSTSWAGGPRRASRTASARPGSSSGASRNGAGRAESGPSRGDLGPSQLRPPQWRTAMLVVCGIVAFQLVCSLIVVRRMASRTRPRTRRAGAPKQHAVGRAEPKRPTLPRTQTRVLVLNGNGINGRRAAESDSAPRARVQGLRHGQHRSELRPERRPLPARQASGSKAARAQTKASRSSARWTASLCASSTAPT